MALDSLNRPPDGAKYSYLTRDVSFIKTLSVSPCAVVVSRAAKIFFLLKYNFIKIIIFIIFAILVRANAKMIHSGLLPVNPD